MNTINDSSNIFGKNPKINECCKSDIDEQWLRGVGKVLAYFVREFSPTDPSTSMFWRMLNNAADADFEMIPYIMKVWMPYTALKYVFIDGGDTLIVYIPNHGNFVYKFNECRTITESFEASEWVASLGIID